MAPLRIKTATAGTALALAILAGCGTTQSANVPAAAPPIELPSAVVEESAVPILTPPVPALPPLEEPAEAPEGPEEPTALLDIPLDPEVQTAIYGMCAGRQERFCFAMAIAAHESDFDSGSVGDGGRSQGIMQINTKWHTARMERLGVTDLTNPAECAMVGLDIIQELTDVYGFEPESHEMCMAFNMGPRGARNALKKGTTATDYSKAVMELYKEFMGEMEAMTW